MSEIKIKRIGVSLSSKLAASKHFSEGNRVKNVAMKLDITVGIAKTAWKMNDDLLNEG